MDVTTTLAPFRRSGANVTSLVVWAVVLVAGVLIFSGTVPLLSPEVIQNHPYLPALVMPLFLMRLLRPFLKLRRAAAARRRKATPTPEDESSAVAEPAVAITEAPGSAFRP